MSISKIHKNEKANVLYIFFKRLFILDTQNYCKDSTEISYTSHPVSPIMSNINLHFFNEKKKRVREHNKHLKPQTFFFNKKKTHLL